MLEIMRNDLRAAAKSFDQTPELLVCWSRWISHQFNIWAFAYMGDFLLCHPSARYLATASNAVCNFLQAIGVRIHYHKHTPSPVHEIKYLGYLIKDKTVEIPEE